MDLYHKRKEYLEGALKAEATKISNQCRFILEKCEGSLVVENKKKKDMIAELVRKKYDSDPLIAWKMSQNREEVLVSINLSSFYLQLFLLTKSICCAAFLVQSCE